jgi:hypothetical protein
MNCQPKQKPVFMFLNMQALRSVSSGVIIMTCPVDQCALQPQPRASDNDQRRQQVLKTTSVKFYLSNYAGLPNSRWNSLHSYCNCNLGLFNQIKANPFGEAVGVLIGIIFAVESFLWCLNGFVATRWARQTTTMLLTMCCRSACKRRANGVSDSAQTDAHTHAHGWCTR